MKPTKAGLFVGEMISYLLILGGIAGVCTGIWFGIEFKWTQAVQYIVVGSIIGSAGGKLWDYLHDEDEETE